MVEKSCQDIRWRETRFSPLADTGVNLPGEQLYTNQTHPYFRAPHIYIAPMMRFTLGMERG